MSNLRTLSLEVSEWCGRNFDTHLPHLGVLEEVGELTHAVLKREQKIRNMGNGEAFKEACIDALGDAGVYLMHYCGLHNVYINEGKILKFKHNSFEMEQLILASLSELCGRLIGETLEACDGATQVLVTQIWQKLGEFAMLQELDIYYDCVKPTWDKVKLRDWRKFPKNGVSE